MAKCSNQRVKNHGVKMILIFSALILVLANLNLVLAHDGGHEGCLIDGYPFGHNVSWTDPECEVNPVDGCDVRRDVTFIPKIYTLPIGIDICTDNVTLDCNGATLSGNGYFEGIRGDYIDYVTIKNCRIINYESGMYLLSSSNNLINNNTANLNGDAGIFLVSSSHTTIKSNTLNSNGRFGGIRLQSSNFNTLTDNTASNNIGRGIQIYLSSNFNTIKSNIANNNWIGIRVSVSSNFNTLTNNIANNNEYGIYITDSHDNILKNNTITANDFGATLLDSNNNLIFNNFFNNTINARDEGINSWNITKTAGTNIIGGPFFGGNFWHDYEGGDLNGDGLGDTQLLYNSQGSILNGGDMHPLTNIMLPKTFSIIRGQLLNGILADLFASDDSRLDVKAGLTLFFGEPPAQIEIFTHAPTNSVSELKFTLESSINTPNIEQRIELFNYITETYERVDTRQGTTSDSVVEVVISSNPDRFINFDREMKAKIIFKATGLTLVWPWIVRIDQTMWEIVE